MIGMLFSLPPIVLAVMLVSMGAFAWALSMLLGPSTGKAKARRLQAIRDRHVASTEGAVAAQMRKTVANRAGANASGLAALLPRQEAIALRLSRTGKPWTITQYLLASMGLFVAALALFVLMGLPLPLSLLLGLVVGLGVPHMIVSRLIAKRVKAFSLRFADAIDLLVRGLRSGLPVTETFGLIGNDLPGPIGEEFKLITERMRIGKSVDAALADTAASIGTPEFKFFCITITIQRETGGNLAETLGNLSDVLRKRTQMGLKIKAMSSEAKASAYIVGALPFFVFGIVYYMSPDYLAGFFTDPRLIYTGIGALGWMSIGAMIMGKMVRFEI